MNGWQIAVIVWISIMVTLSIVGGSKQQHPPLHTFGFVTFVWVPLMLLLCMGGFFS